MASHGRDTIVWVGLLLLLAAAPLPFASISALAQASLTFAVLALFAMSGTESGIRIREWPAITERRFGLLMACWGIAMAFAFFQAVPVPPALVEAISPALSELYSWSLPEPDSAGQWRPLSTTPAATIQTGLLIGAYAATFVLVVRHCRTRRRMLTLAMTLVAIGVGQAVYGLSQVGSRLTSPASGTFVNRNHFAALLIMALSLNMGMVLARWWGGTYGTAASAASEPSGGIDRWARTSPLLVTAFILLAAVIFSFSRTGLAIALCAALIFGISGSLGSVRRFMGFFLISTGALALLLLTGAWRGLRIVAYRFEAIEESYRLAAWHGTYDLFQSSPWVGVGLGSLVDNIPRFLPPFIKEVFDHTHNEPLEILAEGGMLYAALFGFGLLVYFGTVMPAWGRRHDPWARGLGWGGLVTVWAVLAFSLVEFPLRMPANGLILSAILALTWVAVHDRFENPGGRASRLPAARSGLTARLMLVAAVGGMIVSGLTATAGVLNRAGDYSVTQAETQTGDAQRALLSAAERLYRRARAIEPWQPAHAYKLARLYETAASSYPLVSEPSQAAWDSATDFYQDAVRLHPGNARIQAGLAWAALQSGNHKQAARSARAAQRLAPADPNVRFAVSKWYLVQWDTLSDPERELAASLIKAGAADLPLEYVDVMWRFIPDLATIQALLPQDVKVRRILLGALTERQLFSERWAEQQAYPDLRILSPDREFLVLGYGRLTGRRQPWLEASAAGAWTGTVDGWLSAGLTAVSRIVLPPGEAVLFIPVRAQAAGNVWPVLSLTIGEHAVPTFSAWGDGWHTIYIHVYSHGGAFPLRAMLTNGAVVRENGEFAERRIKLAPVMRLTPSSFRDS